MKRSSVGLMLISILLFAMAIPVGGKGMMTRPDTSGNGSDRDAPYTWIVQWAKEPDPDFVRESIVVAAYPASGTYAARPKRAEQAGQWMAKWSRAEGVRLFQPNQRVRIAKAPNDPLLRNQQYLKQIRAEQAWDVATSNESVVIAIVDTGVDLDHPDLKDNLVPGVNLIQPDAPPQDDNGHGTSVAGVIAAIADNDSGTAGLLWKTKIMPIKALESDGNGDEDKLGEGILYAVDHGAKIVVLSLGLNKYSPYMENIVRYAEDNGVVLVAASGNEGNAVKYPAAYETVLAVGGVGTDNKPEALSNAGPELDVVAPWVVFTTARDGGYEYKDGTSMAAPQVAGVCALILSKYPDMKPVEVRNLIRQTAQNIGPKGWDKESGYGLLRADRALREEPRDDIYEPNDSQVQASPISVSQTIQAALGTGDDDWYAVDVPYDGTVTVQVGMSAVLSAEFDVYDEAGGLRHYSQGLDDGIPLEAKKGKLYLRLSAPSALDSVGYELSTRFSIYRDPFEDNNRQYKAFMLPARSQLVTGTLDQYQDADWFSMRIDHPGSLKLKVSPDTARIDPVLLVQRKGEKELLIDHNPDGQPETYSLEVEPGIYYFRIGNVPNYPYPVMGEYTFDIDLTTRYDDPNEPNDKPYQATLMGLDSMYYGVLDKAEDADWFKFKLDGESLVRLSSGGIPVEFSAMRLYDYALKSIDLSWTPLSETQNRAELVLPGGTYYMKLTADIGFPERMYSFSVRGERMIEGYADIYGHWAEAQLLSLIRNGYADGYGGYRFYPERSITRAEAAALLARTMQLTGDGRETFGDVPDSHWAFNVISQAYRAGIVNGYPDGTFEPDRSITRMEMAMMLANATNKHGRARGAIPFADVSETYWGTPILRQMQAEGWIDGFDDGTFRPERTATRAEFMSLVVRMLNL